MLIKLDTIVLKVASRCNIDCTYCYEYNRGDTSWKQQPKKFSLENSVILSERINEYARTNTITHFNVVFHGGEPALAGSQHLDQVMTCLEDRCTIPLRFGMQTNGTLVNSELINVLKKHNVRVAVSIDGTEYANRHRIDHDGKPTWARAIKGIVALKGAGLFSGIQVVIDGYERPEDILATLMQFSPPEIELGQPFGTFDNPPQAFSNDTSLGEWLLRAFVCWVSTPSLVGTRVIILADALRAVLSDESISEWFPTRPPGYLIVAADANLEGLDTLKISGDAGRILNLNIREHSFEQALQHPQIQMRARQTVERPDACQQCAIKEWCNGGYYPTRHMQGSGFNNKSIYCSDWMTLFDGIGRWAIQQDQVSPEKKHEIAARLARLKEQVQSGLLQHHVRV